MTDEAEPDLFLVALAAYQLVCDAADSSPLVLIVDDAHWLDRSSLGVLTFIARRLESEPVALVAAVRDGHATPLDEARLPTLELERLCPSAAAELLDRGAPELHPVLRARVLAEAAGNPLALVELARAAAALLRPELMIGADHAHRAPGAGVRGSAARPPRGNAAQSAGRGARQPCVPGRDRPVCGCWFAQARSESPPCDPRSRRG